MIVTIFCVEIEHFRHELLNFINDEISLYIIRSSLSWYNLSSGKAVCINFTLKKFSMNTKESNFCIKQAVIISTKHVGPHRLHHCVAITSSLNRTIRSPITIWVLPSNFQCWSRTHWQYRCVNPSPLGSSRRSVLRSEAKFFCRCCVHKSTSEVDWTLVV